MCINLFVFAFLIVFSVLGETNVIINEIMPSNIDVIMDDINEFPDSWVELSNVSRSSVNIDGYYLSDDKTNKKKWKIDSSIVISSNEYILFYLDERDTLKTHANFKLDINGGTLFLTADDGVTSVDSVTYKKMTPNLSYGRITNGDSKLGWFRKATPNRINIEDYYIESEKVAPKPEFSVIGGVFSDVVNVALSVPSGFDGAKIYYTTDGSEPSELSQVYSEPLSLSVSTNIRAKVIDPNYLPRPSTTQSYIITNRKFDLPVLSVTTDTSYLFDPHIGIFVWGENYISQYAEEKDYYKYRMNSNLFYDWRRPANIEYFDGENHVSSVNQICEIRISGGGSRFQHEQKSFVVYANKRFETKRLYHKFFSDKLPVEKGNGYKSLVVRNAGNDCNYTFMRDALIQNLYNGKANVDCASYQPAVVFINGKYWGIENIRERTNDHYYLANYNLDEDQIDMYDNLALQNGTEDAYEILKSLISGEFTFNELNELVDIDNFLRYYVLYLFVWNADWPGNNYVFWRPRDGKFRWVLKDLDFGFGLDRGFSGDTSANTVFYMLNPGVISDAWAYNENNTFLFRRALADKDSIVKQKFLDYYLVTLGDLLNENIITNMTDSLAENIRNEFTYHSERWAQPQRYTAPSFQSHKALTPEKWENEILYIKKWVNARIRNVYDSLAVQFNLGDFTPVKITTSVNKSDKIFINSIKVHYPKFDGKWPSKRPLLVSVDDSLTVKSSVKHWEVRTVSGEDTSDAEIITGQKLDLTSKISAKKLDVLVHAVLNDVSIDNNVKKLTNARNVIIPKIVRNELVIKSPESIKDLFLVELFDISGKVLKTATMKSGYLRMSLSGLSSRVVLLSVKNGANKYVFKLLL